MVISDIFTTLAEVKQIDKCSPSNISQEILASTEPLLLKGLVKDWPVVAASKQSYAEAASYLKQYYQGMPVSVGIGDADSNGRLFYNKAFTKVNFKTQANKLDQVLNDLLSSIDDEHPTSLYVGSTHIDGLLPQFRLENDLAAIAQYQPLASMWLGNQSIIAAHHDMPSNIACCVAGKRRFTLFPPEQVENLYIGPLDNTPAGQAISLVDFHQPDWIKFPKFKQALKFAQVVELAPGDALFIPSMWWHHVEGLSRFNILINYWWQSTSPHMGAPIDAMYHALLNIKNLPKEQKKAWQAMFNHYVFNDDPNALSHIPEHALGILDSDNEMAVRQIRAKLLNKLNR
ncbi:MAG: hypothetical protein ACI9LM_003591 [Alteromonadaceae bacterium]|jgi:hypothetical protein